MFEVPDAKRVRRENLYDSASDEDAIRDDESDSSLRGKLNAQLSGLLDLSFTVEEDIETQQTPGSRMGDAAEIPKEDGDSDKTGEEAFTFRLFRDEEPSRKVVLEPQNAGTEKGGDGAFVVARRPISYYLAEETPPDLGEKFRTAAVSADYLLKDAKRRRWGLEKPWKVTTITITADKRGTVPSGPISSDTMAQDGKKAKKRPGKKRRIMLRVREKAKLEREEAAKQQLVEKGEHIKDKKKRLNRQKKLKRRAKEREKKQGTKNDGTSEQSSRANSPDGEKN
ncbi:hypothetical protein F4819DRAFT_440393 [Hypoxylon fuscum]|nr:hypothetical protein F4819DRAFT_440393 [Hypoxylon fuscum]